MAPNKSNSQNPPPFDPLHGVIKFFQGFGSLFSNFIFNNHGSGGGGGDRNHRKNAPSNIFCPPAIALEDKSRTWDSHGLEADVVVQLKRLSGYKKYKVSSINFLNPRTRATATGAEESFSDMVSLQPGGVYTKQTLIQELESLSSSPYFDKIDFDFKTNPDGSVDVNIPFEETVYPSKSRIRCVSIGLIPDEQPVEIDPHMTAKEQVELMRRENEKYKRRINGGRECILPKEVEGEIRGMLMQTTCLRASLLRRILNKIQKWYHDNGYHGAFVVNHNNLENNHGGDIVVEMVEGDITKLGIVFQDKLGIVCEGNTDIALIKRVLPKEVAVGNVYNRRAFEEAMQNLGSLNIFSSISSGYGSDEKNNGGISAQFALQELQQKWSDVSTEWSIVPGRNSRPTLASLQPGATVSFGYRNIKGLNRSLQGAITLGNLFSPEDDISYNFDYTHPYLDGIDDPRNRTFKAECFNTKKVSPVFTGGPGVTNSPIWVCRDGIKATITEDYSRQSKFSYGLVLEEVKTRDEGGDIVGRGNTVSYKGEVIANGPPTTLSGTGVDRMAFLQANLTRDNTRFLNGALVGTRDIFQVDQGLGIGSKFAFFNRHKISTTRFFPLMKVEEGKGKAPPPVLVLHGMYGGCVGDLPNHEAVTIGGPTSVRGYSVGEIGASRNKLELAAEVRVPVKGSAYAYAFAEHGNDLGSSVSVEGNPTKSYMRTGHGSSYGAGVKIGNVRAEYAVDHNSNKGGFFVHFGDRF
ncbi:hypothetical protein ACP275_03G033800 [Erythranthe tilingii]